jgi:DNA-binding transcriptional MerR regulator
MVGKARVQKRLYYKIGEACKALGIQPYVLRYWETEFPALAPSKSRSGQRVYSEKEIEIIRRIKELLYEEGYTIAGAKKKLETELASGALGEETEEATESAEPEPVQAAEPPPSPPPAPARRTAKPQAALPAPPPASSALDTDAAERIQTHRSGIEKALREAREILALLDAKHP